MVHTIENALLKSAEAVDYFDVPSQSVCYPEIALRYPVAPAYRGELLGLITLHNLLLTFCDF